MITEFLLLAIYNKPRLSLAEVAHALGMSMSTAYNKRAECTFPVYMAGTPLTADIRDVAAYIDTLRDPIFQVEATAIKLKNYPQTSAKPRARR